LRSVKGGDFLLSGYWPGWQANGAAGQPMVIRWASGTQEATLIGLESRCGLNRARGDDRLEAFSCALGVA
jgi:hypothetical protein